MKSRICSVVSLALLAVSVSMIGCDYTSYQDFMEAYGTVYQADGRTPAKNLSIGRYDWVINFTDGSTVAVPFSAPNLATDLNGKFGFSSGEIQLYSGRQERVCTEVCVDWDTDYEDVCTYWDTEYEDVCVQYNWDGYCVAWETQRYDYCLNWETRAYQYCSYYGEDCDYVYPMRSVTDIASAFSEITYNVGASRVTTQSEQMTYPREALSRTSVQTSSSSDRVDQRWVQKDEFVTILGSGGAWLTRYSGKSVPTLGKTHKPATIIPSERLNTLTDVQKAKLEATRKACKAYPRVSK